MQRSLGTTLLYISYIRTLLLHCHVPSETYQKNVSQGPTVSHLQERQR
jgi:hypothetical protein